MTGRQIRPWCGQQGYGTICEVDYCGVEFGVGNSDKMNGYTPILEPSIGNLTCVIHTVFGCLSVRLYH
jgi:hypothetical protein